MKPRHLLVALLCLLFIAPLSAEEEKKADTPSEPPVYSAMQPALVVNVADGGRVRHMQVSIQLKLASADLKESVQQHTPALRHELIMLLSDQPVKKLTSSQGKIALREDALSALQQVMKQNIHEPAVEAVYFTEMIIQ